MACHQSFSVNDNTSAQQIRDKFIAQSGRVELRGKNINIRIIHAFKAIDQRSARDGNFA